MSKLIWKPGTMVYPLPAVLVTCGDISGKYNALTVAWVGTVCTNPAMTYISLRPERYSYGMIKESGEFVINLTTENMARAVDYCGVKSGRDVNKFEQTGLTVEKADIVKCPVIKQSPVSIECKVDRILELGSHHMFLANVVSVDVDEEYIDDKGRFHLDKANPVCYSHGSYYGLKKPLGFFGFSVAKNKTHRRK